MEHENRTGLVATLLGIVLGGLGLGLLRVATAMEDYTVLFIGFVLLAWGLAALFGPTRHGREEPEAHGKEA